MYNPLIELKHKDGSSSYVRHSEISVIKNWDSEKSIKLIDGNKFNLIQNLSEIIELYNEIENRNESTRIFNN